MIFKFYCDGELILEDEVKRLPAYPELENYVVPPPGSRIYVNDQLYDVDECNYDLSGEKPVVVMILVKFFVTH